MKIKYGTHLALLLVLLNLLFAAGCAQATTQMSSPTAAPITTATTQISPSPAATITPTTDVPTITALEAFNLIKKKTGNPDFVILDVRTADEFNSGHIASAVNVDYYSTEFKSNIGKLDKNKQYLVYCRSGIRSATSTRIMMDLGFKEIQNLASGITQWIQDGYPVVK